MLCVGVRHGTCAAGNPALKMQHWMKNQLVKESYAEQWEDIVRSGAASSVRRHSETSIISPADEASTGTAPANGSAPIPKLPAEFGAKDKVPAKGTAPMGPQDYADGSQWTERDGTMQRRESAEDGAKSEDGASDRGYIGGDGAKLGETVRQKATDNAKDLASSKHESLGLGQLDGTSETLPKQPQGGNDEAGPASNREAGQAAAASASSNGAKPDGGSNKSASNDSDWWRELTAASKRNDCSSVSSALSSNQNQQNGAKHHSSSNADGVWKGAKSETKSGQQNGAFPPPSSSTAASSTSRNGAGSLPPPSPSPSDRRSSGWDTSSSSPRQGLGGQIHDTSRPSGRKSASVGPEEQADIEKRTQDVKDLASKIENQVPGMKVGLQGFAMSVMHAVQFAAFSQLTWQFGCGVCWRLEASKAEASFDLHEKSSPARSHSRKL